MRLLLSIVLAVFTSPLAFGQMTPINALHLVDLYSLNAAYGGLDKSVSVNFNYRDQWTGVEGNPEGLRLNAHLPVALWGGGAGLSLHRDNTGTISRTNLSFSANKFIERSFGLLSLGARIGMVRTSVDGSGIITPEGIYNGSTLSHEDPILSLSVLNGVFPRYSLSAFIGHQQFDLAISASNIFSPPQKVSDFSVESNRNVTLFSRVPIRQNQLILLPSILLRTDFKVIQTEVGCLVKSGSVFGGLTLRGYNSRSLESIAFIIGIRLNDHYTLTYGYDYGLNDLAVISRGSHELNINYNLNKLLGLGLPPEIIYNPRNL